MIIDPSLIIIEGLKKIIESGPEFKIARFYQNNSVTTNILLHGIDILLVNPRMSKTSQFSKFIHDCRMENENMVIFALQTSYVPMQMMNLVDGVIEMDDDPSVIISKLRNVSCKTESTNLSDNCELSSREKEVLVLVAKGKTNKEIAELLNLSVYTVIAHRKNITAKTNIKSVSGLTIYALLNNLISQTEMN